MLEEDTPPNTPETKETENETPPQSQETGANDDMEIDSPHEKKKFRKRENEEDKKRVKKDDKKEKSDKKKSSHKKHEESNASRTNPSRQVRTTASYSQTKPRSDKKALSKRHKNFKPAAIHGIKNPSIKRLARRAGVKRISTGAINSVRDFLHQTVTGVVTDAVTYTEYAKLKTVKNDAVIRAINRRRRGLYI